MRTPLRLMTSPARASGALAAVAGVLAAMPVLAQSGTFEQPLHPAARQPQARSSGDTTMVITSTENGRTYSVKVHNNEISADVDGTPVPPDRIERKGDVLIIKGADGKTEKTFDIGIRPQRMRVLAAPQGGLAIAPEAQAGKNNPWSVAVAPEPPSPPPVMVGITMSNPDSGLAAHLGLDEDAVFIIDRVVPDLPAAKAGLRPNDIVTAIDGQTPASQEKFREALRSRKAGQTLELTILRKGLEQKVQLELVAYDRAKLAVAAPEAAAARAWPDAPGDPSMLLRSLGYPVNNDQIRAHLEEALKSLQGAGKSADANRAAEDALRRAIESLSESSAAAAGRAQVLDGQLLTLGVDRADVGRKLERLNEQLEKLNQRLDEIERQLGQKK